MGGAVNLVVDSGRVRFNVNLQPVEERGVRISACCTSPLVSIGLRRRSTPARLAPAVRKKENHNPSDPTTRLSSVNRV